MNLRVQQDSRQICRKNEGQETAHISLHSMLPYCKQKRSSLGLILSQLNSVCIFTICFSQLSFILSYIPNYCELCLFSEFPTVNPSSVYSVSQPLINQTHKTDSSPRTVFLNAVPLCASVMGFGQGLRNALYIMTENAGSGGILLRSREELPTVLTESYCNGFDQRFARQQLCKHGTTSNNKGSCVFRVRGDVTQQWVETT
jgi:hypothetical protein